jgi:hypothetical protein
VRRPGRRPEPLAATVQSADTFPLSHGYTNFFLQKPTTAVSEASLSRSLPLSRAVDPPPLRVPPLDCLPGDGHGGLRDPLRGLGSSLY